MRVLLAESNDERMTRMHEILEADGRFEMLGDSTDGDTALRRALTADVIVLDRDLQGRGWLGIVSELLRMERRPAIVVVTPNNDERVHRAARREGADDIVVWPAEASELPARLAALECQISGGVRGAGGARRRPLR